jgi:hypothetical protein
VARNRASTHTFASIYARARATENLTTWTQAIRLASWTSKLVVVNGTVFAVLDLRKFRWCCRTVASTLLTHEAGVIAW